MKMSIFYEQTIKCKTTESAWLVDTEKTNNEVIQCGGGWSPLLKLWGGVRFLFIKKGQRLSFVSNLALVPATFLEQGTSLLLLRQLFQLMLQHVNQKQQKRPPCGVPLREKTQRDSPHTWGHRKSKVLLAPPCFSPPASPDPECEQSSANPSPPRQKGTAVCLQPLIQIQSHPLPVSTRQAGAHCVYVPGGNLFREVTCSPLPQQSLLPIPHSRKASF